MLSASPIAIALAIIIVLTIVGFLLTHLRSKSTFSGYEEYAKDVRDVAKSLNGEVFRDGEDLVVSGNYRNLPAVIRLSYSETTPGLNLRMRAASTFTMSVVPKGAQASEGRVLVRTGDDMFDSRFTTRSDHPTQAKMFLGAKVVLKGLNQLCCSQKTFFTLTTGSMELSELIIPSPYTGNHILAHLESMRRLAGEAAEMPGAHTVSIQKIEKEGSKLVRVAIAVGVVAAIVAVVAATRSLSSSAQAGPVDEIAAKTPAGVLPIDAPFIPSPEKWRGITAEEFDADAASWLRGYGVEPAARIPGDYSGKDSGRDVAYVLVTQDGTRRVVLLVEGTARYDANYPQLAVVARFPKGIFPAVQWTGTRPSPPDGDGLLVVRKTDDRKSAMAIFLSEGQVVTGQPANYQSLSLE